MRQYEWKRRDTEQKILKSLREVKVHYKPMSINGFTKQFHISKATLGSYLPTLIRGGYVNLSVKKNIHFPGITAKGLSHLRMLEAESQAREKIREAKVLTVNTGHVYYWALPADKVDEVVKLWNDITKLLTNTSPDSFLRIVATAKTPES